MKNKLLSLILIFCGLTVLSQTVSTTITYSGAQSQGCCNVCGLDYWCINNTGGCGTTAACDSRTFLDPVPAGNIITGVSITYFGAGCYASAEPSYINNVLIGSSPNNGNCACGACDQYPTSNTFPCPTGLPSYNYGGVNTFQSCPNDAFCPQKVTITFTYTPVSIAPTGINAVPNPTCGGAVTLTKIGGSLGTGATWKWYSGSCGGTLEGTGTSINVTPTSTTTYFLRAEGGGCGTTTCAQVTVTVNTPSTDPVSATASLTTTCGDPTTLTVNGGSLGTGASWKWYSGSCGGNLEGTGASITVTPTNNITYYVRAEGACNNTNCVQVSITVNPVPFAIATPASATICSGATTSINLSSFVPGTTFAWTVAQTNVSGGTNNNGTTIADVLTATGSTPGNAVYTVTPTANGCVGNPITVNIQVNPIPVISTSPVGAQTICAGSVLPINLTSNVTGTSFTWTVVETGLTGANAGSGTTITDSLVATGGTSGTAIYTINASANSCNALPINDTITLNPDPGSTATATPSASTICSGTSTSISLSSSVSGTVFTWTETSTGITGDSPGTGATIAQTLTLTNPSVPGSVTYLVASTASGCTGTPISVTVSVHPTPTASVTPAHIIICSGDSTTFAMTSNVPGTTFSWTVFQSGGVSGGTFGTDSVIHQTLTNSAPSADSAVYTIIPSFNGCAGSAITASAVVNPLADASFVYSSATYCTNGANPTPIVTGQIGGIFTATPVGLSINPSTGTINLATSQPGPYTLTYTTGGTCSNSFSITMTIDNSSPFSNFTYTSATYCQNGTNPTPNFGSGASAGVFSSTPVGLQFVSINTGEIDLSQSTPGTYTVINHIPASGNCVEATDTTVVTITASDDASFVYSSATYCTTGSPQTPIITGLPGGTFSSSPSGLSLNPSTGTITLSTSAYGVYNLSYTTNGACPDTFSITMTIDTITPSATFSYPASPVCQNGINPAPAFGPNASAGIFTATPSGLAFVSVNTGVVDLANSTPGIYTVTNTIPASGVCSPISATSTIVIGSADDASFVYTSATYCKTGPNQTPAITGLPGGVFSAVPPGLSINPSTGTINLGASQVGSYTLTYTTSGSCPNTSSIVMTIQDSTTSANFHYSGSAFCQNGSNQFPIFPLGSSAGYFTASPSGLTIVNPNTGELNLANSTPGTYVVTNTIPQSGICAPVVSTYTITVNQADDASFTYTSATYCTTGNPQSPTITGVPGGTFSAVPPGLSINPTTGTINLSQSLVGSYTLTYTTFGTCPNTSSIVMTINDTASSATFSYAGSPFCQSNGTNPFPTYIPGASAGIYSANPAGLVFIHVNTGEIDLAHSTPGTYTVTNTIPQSGACAFVSASYTITINGAPSVIATPNQHAFCSSSTAALTINLNSNIPGTSFTWTVAQSGVSAASGGSGSVISQNLLFVGSPGTVTYNISPNANGCAGQDTSITIVINPMAIDTTTIHHVLANCGTNTGGVNGVVAATGQTPFTYQWKDSTNNVVGGADTLQNVGPGNYTLTITDGNGCSRNVGPFNVQASPPVVAAFTADPITGQTPLSVNFTNTSVGAATYKWNFGTGDSSVVMSPTYIFTPLGSFQVCLTAISATNCVDTACDSISIYINSLFIIPNIFTPNGDDINDVFTVHGVGLKTLNAEIYNRWGQKEYEWHTVNGGWDGRSTSGVQASDGTYYYIINAEGIDGKKYFEKGSFSLVRNGGGSN